VPDDPLAAETFETGDAVDLSVPTSPELVRLARVTASGLASRLGFTYEEVEDLRLAIDELCYALVGNGQVGGTLHLHYAIRAQALEIEGAADLGPAGDGRTAHLSELSERILGALVDEHSVDVRSLRFRLVKRRG
jgi:serine/threonine-protein kinase RsbW